MLNKYSLSFKIEVDGCFRDYSTSKYQNTKTKIETFNFKAHSPKFFVKR